MKQANSYNFSLSFRYSSASLKVILRTNESLYLVDFDDIMRCESESNYTHIFINPGKKITVSKTLKEYECLLNGSKYFFRLHQSHLINLNYIERFDKKDGGLIIMKDKSIVPVSPKRKNDLFKLLENF